MDLAVKEWASIFLERADPSASFCLSKAHSSFLLWLKSFESHEFAATTCDDFIESLKKAIFPFDIIKIKRRGIFNRRLPGFILKINEKNQFREVNTISKCYKVSVIKHLSPEKLFNESTFTDKENINCNIKIKNYLSLEESCSYEDNIDKLDNFMQIEDSELLIPISESLGSTKHIGKVNVATSLNQNHLTSDAAPLSLQCIKDFDFSSDTTQDDTRNKTKHAYFSQDKITNSNINESFQQKDQVKAIELLKNIKKPDIPFENNSTNSSVHTKHVTDFEQVNESNKNNYSQNKKIELHPFFANAKVKTPNNDEKFEGKEQPNELKFRRQEKEHAAFNFLVFSKYCSNTKPVTARNLNSPFNSLEDLLYNTLPYPSNENGTRIKIWQNTSKATTLIDKCTKAFLCTSFLPITVGSKAAEYLDFTFKGDLLPQFQALTEEKKISCVVCEPFNEWLATKCHVYSTKVFNFEGFRQVYEHYISKKHREAINWFKSDKVEHSLAKAIDKTQQRNITDFVKVESPKYVNCHFVWQSEFVISFQDDSFIRRKQPKTIFKEFQKWLDCANKDGHQNCFQYKYWKKMHSAEFKVLCEVSSSSAQSVFVPGNNTIIIEGCSIAITGGIKSLNPPCLGKAVSYGDHPYTCKNCYLQIPILNNLIKKRKESQYVHADRIGSNGFRTTYAKISEKQKFVSSVTKVAKHLTEEVYKMQKTILSRRSWQEKLSEACKSRDEELMVTNLLSLFHETSNNVQFEVLKNLIGKLKSGNNHKFSSIIKDMASIHKNRLGSTNYSLLQSLFGLPGKTTCNEYTKEEKISLGINMNILKKAEIAYEGQPVIDCTDEGRTLRFISAVKQGNEVELIGCSWDADISNWEECKQKIPRAGNKFPDDFSAIQSYVDKAVSSDMLAKSTAFHNLAAMTGVLRKPHLYLVWPTPNKGYDSTSLLKIWDVIRYKCFVSENGTLKLNPIMLMGHSSDSAGFQLSAAKQLMTPNDTLMLQGVKYLSLGIGESEYASPYLGPLPATAYLDYDHELRLFLKCLKYETLELTFWSSSVIATISHLQELQKKLLTKGLDCPFLATDLLFARFLDQNCDAAIRVFNVDVCALLEKYVDGSNGTILYIHAVCLLMSPFLKPISNPESMQRDLSAGINILRLWRTLLFLKKERLYAGKGAASDPCKRGHFITYGCFTTAELLFTAATNHMLGMFAHFKFLGPIASSPTGSGTKTTERIISEIQGKTNQIQSLDAQPTLADILTKVSAIQFNQEAEERLISLGARKHQSTNRRRLSHKIKNVQESDYNYPNEYNDFLENQRKAFVEGYEKAKELFIKWCPNGAEFLKHKHCWDSYDKKYVVRKESLFSGSVDANYSLDILLNIKSADFLGKHDHQMDLHLSVENSDFSSDLSDNDDNVVDFPFEDLDKCEVEKTLKREWSVSHKVQGKIENVHIQTVLKILLPREYVSRERSKRHIAACFLPGLKPIDKDHDVVQFEFVMIKLSQGVTFGKVVSITESGKSVRSTSSCSTNGYFRAYLLEEKAKFLYTLKEPLTITRSLKVEHVFCRVHMTYNDGYYKVLEEDQANVLSCLKRDIELKDFKLAKSLQQTMVPYEYSEVEDIINRKVDQKTHSYLYLAKFQGEEEAIWLPANSFMREVNYSSRRKTQGRSDIKQYAIKDLSCNEKKEKHIKKTCQRKAENNNTDAMPSKSEITRNLDKVGKDLSCNEKKEKHIKKICKRKAENNNTDAMPSKSEITKNLDKVGLQMSELKLFHFKRWITDKEIKAATILLKEASNVNGLQDPILKDYFICVKNGIQIHHDGDNHWLFSCEKERTVLVYDTLYNEPSNETKKQLFKCYRHLVIKSKLKIIYPSIQIQTGSDDCGFFAIAFAVESVINQLTDTTVFNQKMLRSHLIDCFKRGRITPFPKCNGTETINMKDSCQLVLDEI